MNEELFKDVFKSWCKPMLNFLNTDYFSNLTKFISKSYDSKFIYPTNKRNIFKPFQLTPYNELKVVILSKQPYLDGKATGLAYGNSDSIIGGGKLSPSLLKIKECVEEKVYGGFNLDFDQTLESWSNQGVLLLNIALTVERGKPDSHLKYWNKFTTKVIQTINDNNSGIVFMFWGDGASEFEENISLSKHYVLKCEHPLEAVRDDRQWDCDHFTKANELITKNNGREFCIEW